MIDRKTAEAARRLALSLAYGSDEYRAAVTTWNDFCFQETARLKAKRLAEILPGVFVRSTDK